MIEMYYIRAEAYKHDNHPNRAILNYQMARKLYNKEVLHRFVGISRDDLRAQKLIQRVEKRIYSTYSQELLLLYKTKRFTDGIALCEEIIKEYGETAYNIDYARVSMIELAILHYHYYVDKNKTSEDQLLKIETEKYDYCMQKIAEYSAEIDENSFYGLLLKLFRCFVGIYFKKDVDYSIEKYENELLEQANIIEENSRELICEWILDDLQHIVEYPHKPEKQYSDLYYLLARFKELQDILKIKFLNCKAE